MCIELSSSTSYLSRLGRVPSPHAGVHLSGMPARQCGLEYLCVGTHIDMPPCPIGEQAVMAYIVMAYIVMALYSYGPI